MSKKRNKISKIDTKDVLVVSFSDVNELDNGFNILNLIVVNIFLIII